MSNVVDILANMGLTQREFKQLKRRSDLPLKGGPVKVCFP